MSSAIATAPAKVAAPDAGTLVAQALKKVTSIATLPEVTARIIATVEDPKSTAAKLHTIVSHDPALVTRILKVVNSAFYGLPGQVASIERAIVLLGLNAVKNISVAASLGQMFRGVKLCNGFVAKDLWTHCVAVAVAARELARGMKVPLADEAFLAGMIHDIGVLVELQTAPESLQAVCERAKLGVPDFCALEREIIGVDHQQLGMGLAEQWKFPRSCQLVAGYHHQPGALRDNNRLIVTLVHVADTIVCQMGHGFNLTAAGQQIDPALLAEMQIDPALVERVRVNLPAQLNAASSLFG